MIIEGNKIIFPYRGNPGCWTVVGIWISVLFVGLDIVMTQFVGLTPEQTRRMHIMTIFALLPAIAAFYMAYREKAKRKRGVHICISPEGVRDSKGRLTPRSEIMCCYLDYYNDPYDSDGDSKYSGKSYHRLIVVRKMGESVQLDVSAFLAPNDREAVDFAGQANEVLGFNLFERSHVR